MDEPVTPPPEAATEIRNAVYVTQMLRKLETDLRILGEKVNGIPKTVGETTRADIAQLETRMTKSIGDSETRMTKSIGDSAKELTKSIGDSETRMTKSIGDSAKELTKSIGDSETRMIKWMIGIGVAATGLVIAVLRLLATQAP